MMKNKRSKWNKKREKGGKIKDKIDSVINK